MPALAQALPTDPTDSADCSDRAARLPGNASAPRALTLYQQHAAEIAVRRERNRAAATGLRRNDLIASSKRPACASAVPRLKCAAADSGLMRRRRLEMPARRCAANPNPRYSSATSSCSSRVVRRHLQHRLVADDVFAGHLGGDLRVQRARSDSFAASSWNHRSPISSRERCPQNTRAGGSSGLRTFVAELS